MRRFVWPVRVTASSYLPNGKRVRMDKTVEGAGAAIAGMLGALHSRRDYGEPFLGCVITGITPLGQVVRRVYNPDTHKLDLLC